MSPKKSIAGKMRRMIVGKEKDHLDRNIFHNISLIAFFAWVGLGADGLSSSCYGPEEAFLALGSHGYLSFIVGMMTVITIFIISASYSQIIECFPTGGGGYLVASKLLSPAVGMVSGCALLVDYVLTITLSIASGTDAIFSFLPPEYTQYKLWIALTGVVGLTILNLRGAKESVMPLVPVFLIFIATHLFAIIYAFAANIGDLPIVINNVGRETSSTFAQLGFFGFLALLMRSYSLGAGTYTGIEAVSNGMSVLRDPKIETGKKTMSYMAISLAVVVLGLMSAYLLFDVGHVPGKTLNAVLFDKIASGWGNAGTVFILITLISEALILFVAGQTGFLGGPRVLANMAVDRWVPTKFASLSDRLVTQNGVIFMGAAAFLTMFLAKGSVKLLVIFYSVNVFITFCLSQLGMIKHWWTGRGLRWKRRLVVATTGFLMCAFILVSVVIIKFNEGGWITLIVTGSIVALAMIVKKHYRNTFAQLNRLNSLMEAARVSIDDMLPDRSQSFNAKAKTAVVFVNGYNGLGLHSLFNVIRLFGDEFKNYVFVQIGILDAGNFKGNKEVENLKADIEKNVRQYANFMHRQGRHAEGMSFIGLDVMSEIEKIGHEVIRKYPNSIFFGGQLVFASNTFFDRWLHNHTVFAMQQHFYNEGIPFVMLPIRIDSKLAAA